MKKYHFVFLNKFFPPRSTEGISRYTLNYALSLTDLGHEVSIIAGSNKKYIKKTKGITIYYINENKTFSHIDKKFQNNKLLCRLMNYSYNASLEIELVKKTKKIHAIEAPNWDLEGFHTLANNRDITFLHICTPYKEILLETKEKINELNKQIIKYETLMYNNCSHILAHSKSIIKLIEKLYKINIKDKSIYHPLGLPEKENKFQFKTKINEYFKKKFIALIVGRLERRKNTKFLFKVIESVLKKRKDIHFVFVGKYQQLSENYKIFFINNYKQYLYNVEFTGYVSDQLLNWFYHECDFVIMPSEYESFGLPVVEAMTNSKPSIVSRAGALPELVTHRQNGLIFNRNDIEDAFSQINYYLDLPNSIKKKYQNNAYQTYQDKFNIHKQTNKLINIYIKK